MTDGELGGVIPTHDFITSRDDSVGGHEELPAEVQTMYTNVYRKK